jgi:hypothetical protein
MDISSDNRAAVILTYRAVYYYLRRDGQGWFNALNSKPIRIGLGNFQNAEAIAFADDRRTVMVTGENKNSLLLRVDLDRPATASSAQDGVTIMSFNVQNLFDNVDDPGKDDKAYLPLAAKQNDAHIAACNEIEVESWRNECLTLDWSDEALEFKLGVVAETIRQVNDGQGADIIALQEVENINVLERLRTEYLEDLGYLPAILVEGTDTRGIASAALSRVSRPPGRHAGSSASRLHDAGRFCPHRVQCAFSGTLPPDRNAGRGLRTPAATARCPAR